MRVGGHDLHPVVAWRYDVGGTLTAFFSTAAASDGVQLDMLHDPEGAGRYGVRSGTLLAGVRRDGRWPRLNDLEELVYLLRKRQLKGQRASMEDLLNRARLLDGRELDTVVDRLLVPAAGSDVRRAVAGGAVTGASVSAPVALEVARRSRRLVQPVGWWLHVGGGEDVASAVARRFGRFLPHVTSARVPAWPLLPGWWVRRVAPYRWRPGMCVTWGRAVPFGPDRTDAGHDVESVSAGTVAAMERRLIARLGGRLGV